MEILALHLKCCSGKINQVCIVFTLSNEPYQEKIKSSPVILLLADCHSTPLMSSRINVLPRKTFQYLLTCIPKFIPEGPPWEVLVGTTVTTEIQTYKVGSHLL